MGYQLAYIGIALVFIFIQSGNALQCWKCSSDIDIECADYFNTTRFIRRYTAPYNSGSGVQSRTPYLETCGDHIPVYGQRQVCQKRKETYGSQTVVIRQCTLIPSTQAIGKCPHEVSSSRNVEFCEYCDYDGCNGASSIQQNVLLATLIPACLYLLLRK